MNRASLPYSAVAAAGLIAWAAIGLELWSGPVVPTALAAALPAQALARALHAVFLGAYLAWLAFDRRPAVRLTLAAAMAALALTLVALYRYNSAAALLVLPTVEFARTLSPRALAVVWLAVNALLAAIVVAFRDMETPLTHVGLHASLQLFAILVVRYARAAERARDALAATHAELLATRGVLAESARSQERLRLSRELHDVAGHKLTALRLNLAALAHNRNLDRDAAIALCSRLTEELLDDLRGVVHQLRLHDGLALGPTLARLAAPFPRPVVRLEVADDARVASVEQADAILRAFQEGLTNAARHGDAHNLSARVARDGEMVRLDLVDDGRGHGDIVLGNGLTGMRERLRALGGDLEVARATDGGVHLTAWVPACP
jgi:signal transduction histidine kinase